MRVGHAHTRCTAAGWLPCGFWGSQLAVGCSRAVACGAGQAMRRTSPRAWVHTRTQAGDTLPDVTLFEVGVHMVLGCTGLHGACVQHGGVNQNVIVLIVLALTDLAPGLQGGMDSAAPVAPVKLRELFAGKKGVLISVPGKLRERWHGGALTRARVPNTH